MRTTWSACTGFSFCYRPAAAWAVPGDPAGAFTFASLNNMRKITPRMAALWGQLLLRVPAARLLIAGTLPGSARDRIVAQLTGAGVSPERLALHGWLPHDRYAARHPSIHVSLDTYPYDGSTTTFEALHHGVPVITLAGPVFVSRHGRATLETIGEALFAVDTEEDYMAAAVQLAARAIELPALRRDLHCPLADRRPSPG